MTIDELLELFKEWNNKNDGRKFSYSRILIYDDGSGQIVNEDDDELFEFHNTESLIKKLKT